jgi:hypothetical protein
MDTDAKLSPFEVFSFETSAEAGKAERAPKANTITVILKNFSNILV